jgi:hypothetical protein
VLNHILQHLENVGATVSTTKFILATLTAVIVGHKCTFKGRVPDDSKVQKIHDWPVPKNAMQVHGFLSMCSVLLLINLTKKDIPFEFGPKHYEGMQILKESILESPALQCLDYECSHKVILAVDTSNIAVGFLLSQKGNDGKHYPSCFSSIALSKVESCYLQAKLELY